jgi:hypothetical protein
MMGFYSPKEAAGARGKTVSFIHMINDDEAMIYFTDGTYLLVNQSHGYQARLKFEYVEEEMGS